MPSALACLLATLLCHHAAHAAPPTQTLLGLHRGGSAAVRMQHAHLLAKVMGLHVIDKLDDLPQVMLQRLYENVAGRLDPTETCVRHAPELHEGNGTLTCAGDMLTCTLQRDLDLSEERRAAAARMPPPWSPRQSPKPSKALPKMDWDSFPGHVPAPSTPVGFRVVLKNLLTPKQLKQLQSAAVCDSGSGTQSKALHAMMPALQVEVNKRLDAQSPRPGMWGHGVPKEPLYHENNHFHVLDSMSGANGSMGELAPDGYSFLGHIDNSQWNEARQMRAPHPFWPFRRWTLSISLTEPDQYEGGELHFPKPPEEKLKLAAGDAIFFYAGVGNAHQVTTITKGVRQSALAWFHSEPFGDATTSEAGRMYAELPALEPYDTPFVMGLPGQYQISPGLHKFWSAAIPHYSH